MWESAQTPHPRNLGIVRSGQPQQSLISELLLSPMGSILPSIPLDTGGGADGNQRCAGLWRQQPMQQ